MSPRRYNPDRRKAAMDETRRRIVEAAVELHAKQGTLATTFAMIARRADVAVPTVYNHFPTQGELLNACTGHVAGQAPSLGPQIFAGMADTEARIAALVRAVCAAWRFRAPWLRWGIHEAALVPELGAIVRRTRAGLTGLVKLALEPQFGKRPPAALVALCDVLVDFTTWQRLAGDGELDEAEIERALADALHAVIRSHGLAGGLDQAARPAIKPRRRQP